MNYTVLIVDDLEKLCRIIAKNFEVIGHTAFYSIDGDEGLKILRDKNIDVVLLDLKLGSEDGIEVLKKMKKIKPQVPVFMITGHGTISNAVYSIKNGAYDYIQKPVNFDKLIKMIENAVSLENLREENDQLNKMLRQKAVNLFHTVNDHMLNLLEKIRKFSETEYPVLITGESGTGKDLIADFIYSNSKRKNFDLNKINCAAFSESLLDDELFGHNKGAFTGADSDFMGIFERTSGGTLFLDEIGDMPLSIQAKILRTLQNGEIKRLGGKVNRIVDVRFIAATNKNINELVITGDFREDLFFRLNTFQIHIPPLRERKDDIALLSRIFLKEYAFQSGSNEKSLDNSVEDFFSSYIWSGNVRELLNVINYSCTISTDLIINMQDLPNYLSRKTVQTPTTLKMREEGEKQTILNALKICSYNKTKASEMLRISRRTLYNKMEKYQIEG